MKERIALVSIFLMAATMGWGEGLVQAIPFDKDGNHSGWLKQDDRYAENTETTNNNNLNGNHNGWSNSGGESTFHLLSASNDGPNIRLTTTTNFASVPEPASLLLLGAGLTTIGMWRRTPR